MSTLEFVVVGLAAWRLAYMIVYESGPWGMFERLRARLPLGGLTRCIYCASVWTAAAAYVMLAVGAPTAWMVYVLAASGLAMMLWRYTGGEYHDRD